MDPFAFRQNVQNTVFIRKNYICAAFQDVAESELIQILLFLNES